MLAVLLIAAGLAVGPAPAWSAEEHLFDPHLSLTGSCAASKVDEEVDPGCPYLPPAEGGPRAFENPCGTAVDRYGDVYVASSVGAGIGKEGQGWIDIFDADGKYLTRIDVTKEEEGGNYAPCSIAVDSTGELYVTLRNAHRVVRYTPVSYPPGKGTTYSGSVPVFEECGVTTCYVAVDPSNDHVYIALGSEIEELDSAAHGNGVIEEEIGFALGAEFGDMAVCGQNHDVYATGTPFTGTSFREPSKPRMFVFDGSDGHKKIEIAGPPGGEFGYVFGSAGIAVDQVNCDAYVDDIDAHHTVDQFAIEGSEARFVGQLPKPPKLIAPSPFAALAVDDPIVAGEAGYESPNEGYVYVTSGEKQAESHLFAYRPKVGGPPLVEAQEASNIAETEAVLEARLNPGGLPTTYRFEYVTEAEFDASEYATAKSAPVPDGEAGEGGGFIRVSVPVGGLTPGVVYHFRLVAENEDCPQGSPTAGETGAEEGCQEGDDVSFATFPASPPSPTCSNATLRTGPSASLPDCRAYELVTPPSTNGRAPTMTEFGGTIYGAGTDTEPVSPDGESLVFGTEGGALVGLGGGGYHDAYVARRSASGWQSGFAGVSGEQASAPVVGGFAADHGYSFWEMGGNGNLVVHGESVSAHYVHRPGGVIDPKCSPEPEGDFEWIGCGSTGHDSHALGELISPGGEHVVFEAPNGPLEPCAPPTGTLAVYDRTPDGVTHCVSTKLDGSPLGAGEGAQYEGASADGSAVAFKAGPEPSGENPDTRPLYVRLDDQKTVQATSGGADFGGLSSDGNRLVYLRPNAAEPHLAGTDIPRGEIFACEVRLGSCAGPDATQEPIAIGSGEEAIMVNVSADGSHVYFVSPQELGGEGEVGADNLYAWDGSGVSFVAILEPGDVKGEENPEGAGEVVGALGAWMTHALAVNLPAQGSRNALRGTGADPSRTADHGRFIVFESRASLPGYDNAGHREVYRYDDGTGTLTCVSCDPTLAPARSDARLQSNPAVPLVSLPPVNQLTHIANITSDGQRIFFQSGDRLVPSDVDGKTDVYEWTAQGTGGCARAEGCLALISSGNSAQDDYLYAMTPDGHDVFFESADLLTGEDLDGTPSIYDARVEGGFAQGLESPPCQGDACQGALTGAPNLAQPGSAGTATSSPPGPHRCSKGKRLVHSRHGSRCVPKHRGGRHRHRAHRHRRGGRGR